MAARTVAALDFAVVLGVGAIQTAAAESPACTQWDVSGTWETSQSNAYTPEFVFQQQGTAVTGTATIPPDQQARSNDSGPTGQVQGTLAGDQLKVTVTWPPRVRDGVVVQGIYMATVVSGGIQNGSAVDPGSGASVTWQGSGASRCVAFASTPSTAPTATPSAASGGSVDTAATQGGGGLGIPVIGLLAAAGVVAVAGAGVLVQRARSGSPDNQQQQQTQNACNEAVDRWAMMVPKRVDMARRLQQGVTALSGAYAADAQLAAARAELSSQYTTAMALIGAGGGAAAAALLACAAAIGGAAVASASSIGDLAYLTQMLDFMPFVAGGEVAVGSGTAAVQAGFASATAGFTQAATLAQTGAAVGAGTAGVAGTVAAAMSSARSSADAAFATQTAMTEKLATAVSGLSQQLSELDGDIASTLAQLRGCPNIDPSDLDDPRTPIPAVPLAPWSPPRG